MSRIRSTIPLVLVFSVALWLVETLVEYWLISDRTFWNELVHPDPETLGHRIADGVLVLGLAISWVAMGRRQRKLEAANINQALNLRAVADGAPDGVIVHRDGGTTYMNPRGIRLLGLEPEDVKGRRVETLVEGPHRSTWREHVDGAMGGNSSDEPLSMRLLRSDGTPLDAVVSTVRSEITGTNSLLTFFRDVTDELATQREVEASEERLSLALEATRDAVWDWDIANDRITYNDAWARMLGLDPATVPPDRSTWLARLHPDDREDADRLLRAHMRGDAALYEAEVRLRHADGHDVWIHDRGRVVQRDAAGRPLRMTGTLRDISPAKEAEIGLALRRDLADIFLTEPKLEILPATLERLGSFLDSPDGLILSREGSGSLNLQARRRHGAIQLTSLADTGTLAEAPPPLDAVVAGRVVVENDLERVPFHPDPVASLLAVPLIVGGLSFGAIVLMNRPRGYRAQEAELLASLARYLAPLIHNHINAENKERQLLQAQKMEALGALAGGIAHDFNNILQAIIGFTGLAHDITEPDGQVAEDLQRVMRAADRGTELVRRILQFSRREEQQVQPLDPRELIEDAVDLLRPTFPATIAIRTDLVADCGSVVGDRSQLNQVLMNLATNALHAMEAGGGVLEFRLRRLPHDVEPPTCLAGRAVVAVSVRDTGPGMTPEVQGRLFDPFFTTKDVGKGTGLGLSVVLGIVAAHGGDVRLDSQLGVGSTFTFYLPAYEVAAATSTSKIPHADGSAREPAGSTILFIDDEEDIGQLGKLLLERCGHRVTSVADVDEALRQLAASDQWDLVISDLTMPRLTGLQLATHIAKLRPEVPLILITGQQSPTPEALAMHPQIIDVVRKPFTEEILKEAVSRALSPA